MVQILLESGLRVLTEDKHGRVIKGAIHVGNRLLAIPQACATLLSLRSRCSDRAGSLAGAVITTLLLVALFGLGAS